MNTLSIRKRGIICLAIILTLITIFIICKNIFIDTYFELYIPSTWCNFLFDCDSENFQNTNTDLSDEVFGLQRKVKVDEDGDLIISLSKFQFNQLKKSDWLTSFKELENTCLEVSADYSTLTLNASQKIVKELWDSPERINNMIGSAMCKMYYIQLLDGISIYNTSIQYIEKIVETGETVVTEYCRGEFVYY